MTKESGDSSKKEVSTTSTPQFQCPMLKPSNYSLWEIRMQIILEANGLWETIEPLKMTQPDNKKDKTAIAFLYQALPEEQLLQITKHKTAKAIWDALKTRHIGEQRVQEARLQTLKSNFEMLHVMEDDELRLYDMDNKIFMKVTRQKNRLYKASLRIGTHVCLLANLEDDTWLWHARLGHLNFESLISMAQRDLVHGIPTIKHTTQICDVCLIGKHSRAPFPKKGKASSTSPLDLVYGDLCRPISPPTPSEKKYIFLTTQDICGCIS
ncbi:zinc finger, CCHC-type containing protein [Tanacetum coccineum]